MSKGSQQKRYRALLKVLFRLILKASRDGLSSFPAAGVKSIVAWFVNLAPKDLTKENPLFPFCYFTYMDFKIEGEKKGGKCLFRHVGE